MYSSKIKEIWDKIHSIPSITESTNNINPKTNKELLLVPNLDKNKEAFPFPDYFLISDFFINKFQETSKIFSKFSYENFFSFIYISSLTTYNKDSKIFSKDEMCNTYNFILYGEINLYSEEKDNNITINNSLNSGDIYGHLIKDKYKFFAKAKNEVVIVHILKSTFDNLIKAINENIKKFKSNFLQKFFPKLRIFPGDVLIKIMTFFEHIKYKKFDIILSKNNFNDYIYIIISGEIGLCLNYKDLFGNSNINKENNNDDYILLEKLSKGDIVGINSTIEGVKNKYNSIVLSDEAEFYRISKEDLLYYYNYNNELIFNIKSIGNLQDMAMNNKINFLKKNINEKDIINKFIINIESKKNNNYVLIYEDPIDNILYQKWRNVKLGLDEMKNKLLGQKKKRIDENKKNNLDNNEAISKNNIFKNKNINLFSKYAVPNGRLNLKLNSNQIKTLNKSNGICGIKNNNNKGINLDEEEYKEKK
jgi:CRP-like cAMP-binding protein